MTVRVAPMPEAALDEWRAARQAEGVGFPEAADGDGFEAIQVLVDETIVGGAVLTYDDEDSRTRASLRLLQTTLPPDATALWGQVLGALETHVRLRGSSTVVTAVPPTLAAVYQAAGYRATMTTHVKKYEPGGALEMQEDTRVSVRDMTLQERQEYAAEIPGQLRAGMERAGLVGVDDAAFGDLLDRVAGLASETGPEGELLLAGELDGVVIGRLWGTLVDRPDGSRGCRVHTYDLFPEFRGQRLTHSFMGAFRRLLATMRVDDIGGRLYAQDAGARRTAVAYGAGVNDVHLRKDLT